MPVSKAILGIIIFLQLVHNFIWAQMVGGNKYILCIVSLDANFIIVNIYKSLSQVSFLWFNVSLLTL